MVRCRAAIYANVVSASGPLRPVADRESRRSLMLPPTGGSIRRSWSGLNGACYLALIENKIPCVRIEAGRGEKISNGALPLSLPCLGLRTHPDRDLNLAESAGRT